MLMRSPAADTCMKTAEITNAPFQGERHTRRRSRLFVGLMTVLTVLAIVVRYAEEGRGLNDRPVVIARV